MASKLYIGNLAWGVDDESLKNAFQTFGPIREVKVVMDRETGRSRGFGFVTFEDAADAAAATSAMNGVTFSGRNLRVDTAENKQIGGYNRGPGSSDRDSGNRYGGSYSSDRDGRGGRRDRNYDW